MYKNKSFILSIKANNFGNLYFNIKNWLTQPTYFNSCIVLMILTDSIYK